MKNFTTIAAVTSTLLSICLVVSGCSQTMANKPNAETSTSMMSTDKAMMSTDMKKPASSMMSDSKMAPNDGMSDSKMNGMAKDKMESTEMKDK